MKAKSVTVKYNFHNDTDMNKCLQEAFYIFSDFASTPKKQMDTKKVKEMAATWLHSWVDVEENIRDAKPGDVLNDWVPPKVSL